MAQLCFMASFDKHGVANLWSAELLARRLLQIQRAVRRHPRSPGLIGLDCFTLNSLDAMGSLTAADFMMELQKTEAAILKSQRATFEEPEVLRRLSGHKAGGAGGCAGGAL